MQTSLLVGERTLGASESKQHIPFTFAVPTGTTQLRIELNFSPPLVNHIRNMLTLSVFDPNGWRGAGHRHGSTHEVVIGEDGASVGYRAGAIPAGEWTVVVDTHMVIVGVPCVIRVEVSAANVQRSMSDVQSPVSSLQLQSSVLRRPSRIVHRPAWYRGDLHAHSIHSDASWDIPDLLAWARARELDFCTLSDHNTVSGLTQMDAACADDLLTMGGMELTTFWGHALALGMREWIDWRVRDGRTMPQIAAEVEARGGTFVIAHPLSIGDPYCTGCRWRYDDMMPGNARVVEVWNGAWQRKSSHNEDALALSYEWLNAGHRLALTADTDNHGREPEPVLYGFNVVFAAERSQSAILRAVRAGHLYLSAGPTLELNATVGEQHAMMGDALASCDDKSIQMTAHWNACPPNAQLGLIADGKVRDSQSVGASGTQRWTLDAHHARWCLLTLRDAEGQMLALTNPIYCTENIA